MNRLIFSAICLMSAVALASSQPLAGSHWRLVEFRSMDDRIGVVRPKSTDIFTMHLDRDSVVSMTLGCNRSHGRWSAVKGRESASGTFRFGQMVSTAAVCDTPHLDEIVVKQCSYVRSYLMKGTELYLSLEADGGIFVWTLDSSATQRSSSLRSPQDGGPRALVANTRATMRSKATSSSKTVKTFRKGTTFDNLGCIEVNGTYWYEVQPLGGGARGFIAATALTPAKAPDGSTPHGIDDSALRAGERRFDASGSIPCAKDKGQPMSTCPFGVARSGGGDATVVITRNDGRIRAIFFRMGRPVGADVSESEGDLQFRASKEGDLHLIRVGNERYEIPDAVIFGG